MGAQRCNWYRLQYSAAPEGVAEAHAGEIWASQPRAYGQVRKSHHLEVAS
jgi:hypothetical protein